ncbi:MAG: hypothetical protein U0165_19475 [Polyangiaceae bacterium]
MAKQDDDFFRSYYALMPYYMFADPDMNQFVIPEGGSGVFGPDEMWKLFQQEANSVVCRARSIGAKSRSTASRARVA